MPRVVRPQYMPHHSVPQCLQANALTGDRCLNPKTVIGDLTATNRLQRQARSMSTTPVHSTQPAMTFRAHIEGYINMCSVIAHIVRLVNSHVRGRRRPWLVCTGGAGAEKFARSVGGVMRDQYDLCSSFFSKIREGQSLKISFISALKTRDLLNLVSYQITLITKSYTSGSY